MLTAEQIQFFNDNGYLRYGHALNTDEVEEMRAGLDRVIAIEASGGDDAEPEFKYGHRRPNEKNDRPDRPIIQFINMWKREPMYERILHNPHIAGVAAALLDTPRVRLWHDQIISKPPEENGHFHFHQDFYLWPLNDPQIVTCWLALDDVTPENGCMHVVPGSHRDPRFGLEAYADELETLAKSDNPADVPETPRQAMRHEAVSIGKPIALKAGECMFHHCLNFHATPQNVTTRQRRAHVMIFMAEGVRVKLSQSPHHPLIPGFEVADGEVLVGKGFPVSQPT
ncbi:MAG: phytanoyl-CoA dioxygenase family protein [Chloroflexota bacterium]